jgi:hypothetical protein
MPKKNKIIKPKIKRPKTGSDTDEFIPRLYEVEVKNRVYKKTTGRRIRGRQGKYYQETIYFVAQHENEIPYLVEDAIQPRRILGKPKYRIAECERKIKIIKIRRIL